VAQVLPGRRDRPANRQRFRSLRPRTSQGELRRHLRQEPSRVVHDRMCLRGLLNRHRAPLRHTRRRGDQLHLAADRAESSCVRRLVQSHASHELNLEPQAHRGHRKDHRRGT